LTFQSPIDANQAETRYTPFLLSYLTLSSHPDTRFFQSVTNAVVFLRRQDWISLKMRFYTKVLMVLVAWTTIVLAAPEPQSALQKAQAAYPKCAVSETVPQLFALHHH
jgi:hypothetical protein